MSLSALAFLALYAGGLVGALVYAAPIAFLTYQFVYLSNPGVRWWGHTLPDVSWSLVSVVMMIGVLVVHSGKARLNRVGDAGPMKWMFAIIGLNILLLPIAVNPVFHERTLIEFVKLGIIVTIAYKLLATQRDIVMSVWVYLVGAAYIGVVARDQGRGSGARLEGIGPVDSPDANGTATVLVPAIPILVTLFCTGSWRQRLAAVGVGAFIINALVLLNSRGSFLGSAAGTLIVVLALLFSRMQGAGQRLSVVLSLCLGLAGFLYLTDDAFWNRMETLKSIEDDPENGAKRVDYWLKTFEIAGDHPLGGGARAFAHYSFIYMDREMRGGEVGRSVHSTWFQSLVETGWLGLGLLLAMCLVTLRAYGRVAATLRMRQATSGYWLAVSLRAGFVGYLVSISFMDRFRAEVLYWLVLYAAALHSVHCVRVSEVPIATGGTSAGPGDVVSEGDGVRHLS